MQKAFVSGQIGRTLDVRPLKLFFSAVALTLVGIFAEVSALVPTPNLIVPAFGRLKMDLGTCPISTVSNQCGSESPTVGSCEKSNQSFLPEIDSQPKPTCSVERGKVKRFLKLDKR